MKFALCAFLIFETSHGMVAKRAYFINLSKKLLTGQLLVEEIPQENLSWVDVDGKTIMHYAATYDKSGSLIESLYHACPSLLEKTDKAHYTPLHFAALYGNAMTVQKLINCRANVMAKTHSGKTAAHLVMFHSDFPSIKKILLDLSAAGCPMNAQDSLGNTPLKCLSYQGNKQLYNYVINHLKLDSAIASANTQRID